MDRQILYHFTVESCIRTNLTKTTTNSQNSIQGVLKAGNKVLHRLTCNRIFKIETIFIIYVQFPS